MSTINTTLSRMMNDREFAEQLFNDTDNILADYDLTAEELVQIKSMSRTEFVSLATEERKSMASGPPLGKGFFQIRDEGA